MKQRFAKIRKILLRTLLLTVLLAGLAAVLLRSKTVQTYLAQKAASWFSQQIGAEVSIKSLDFDFYRNIHIEDILIRDQKSDTMIFVHSLIASIHSFNTDTRNLQFSSGDIKGAFINIGYHKNDKDKNIDFLLEYFNPPGRKKTGPPKIWKIYFGKLKLSDSRMGYFDEDSEPEPAGVIDPKNLYFTGIDGIAKKLWIIDDSIQFVSENLKAKERSGLNIASFDAVCNIHYKGMDFTDMVLTTPCSSLDGELHFSYPGYKYLDKFISNTQWKGRFKNSSFCLKEASVFSPDLKSNEAVLAISYLNIGGTFDHLKLSNVNIKTGKNSQFRGDYYFEGLPSWRTTYCDFDIPLVKTNAEDLSMIMNGMDLPQQVKDAGEMLLSGKFSGQFIDFKWDGTIETSYGTMVTDMLMNFKPGLAKAEFEGSMSTGGFDLGLFADVLGPSAFDITMKGTGLMKETFQLELDAFIPEYSLLNKTFTDAVIKGKLNARNFTGNARFDDYRLNAVFDGLIDFSGNKPVFDFTAFAAGLDLYELGLDTTHTLVWFNSTVDLSGSGIDDAEGNIELKDVSVHRNNVVYEYPSQNITRYGSKENALITMNGSFVSGEVKGKMALEHIDAIVVNSLAQVLPEKISPVEYDGDDSFQFFVQFHETGLLLSYLFPGLTTSTFGISGFYNSYNGTAMFNTNEFDLTYHDLAFHKIELHSHKDAMEHLAFTASAADLVNADKTQLTKLSLKADLSDGGGLAEAVVYDKTGKFKIDVNAMSRIMADSMVFDLGRSELILATEKWTVDERSKVTVLNNGKITVDDLYLGDENHYIDIKGIVSNDRADKLNVEFSNILVENIRPFFTVTALDSLSGSFQGSLEVAGILGQPSVSGFVDGRRLVYYSQEYGDFDARLLPTVSPGRIDLNAVFIRGIAQNISIDGNLDFYSKTDQLNLGILVPENTDLTLAQAFLQDILTIKEGKLSGGVNLTGTFKEPQINGRIGVYNAGVKIDYLNTSYKFSTDIVANNKGFFTRRPAFMIDENGTGTALATMSITHKNFDDFYFDLKIDSAKNLKCLNTTEDNNDLYFGTAYADGSCHIWGPFDKISMDIKLKSKKNSKIQLLYSDVEQNQIMGFVTFRDHRGGVMSDEEKKSSSSIHRINISIITTPDLEAQFVIDKKLGDAIKGVGNGELRMLYDENENFYLWGNYTVEQGDYVFSLPGINVITRKIALNKGGSISWSGDPFNAVLNMTGSFEKRISPSVLMASVTTNSKSYAPIKVQSNLIMKGNLFSPDISFDIQAPELESSGGGSSNDVYRVIQRIRTDKDETMRQAIALLLFGNFVTPSFAQNVAGGAGISGTGVAGNSLSSIASNVVNDIFTKLGLPTRIQVNIDDVRGLSGGTNPKVFVNSEWFLSERIRLDLNYDPTVAMVVSSVAVPLNFNLEYMTKNENWRIKAFSRSNNLLLQQNNSTVTTGVSGNTLGLGVIYRREFDTWRWKKSTKDSTSNK